MCLAVQHTSPYGLVLLNFNEKKLFLAKFWLSLDSCRGKHGVPPIARYTHRSGGHHLMPENNVTLVDGCIGIATLMRIAVFFIPIRTETPVLPPDTLLKEPPLASSTYGQTEPDSGATSDSQIFENIGTQELASSRIPVDTTVQQRRMQEPQSDVEPIHDIEDMVNDGELKSEAIQTSVSSNVKDIAPSKDTDPHTMQPKIRSDVEDLKLRQRGCRSEQHKPGSIKEASEAHQNGETGQRTQNFGASPFTGASHSAMASESQSSDDKSERHETGDSIVEKDDYKFSIEVIRCRAVCPNWRGKSSAPGNSDDPDTLILGIPHFVLQLPIQDGPQHCVKHPVEVGCL